MQLENCERLLHILSLFGEVSTSKFYELFDTLYPTYYELDEAERYYTRFRVLRFLEMLGHCEYDYEENRVYVCKPILVLLPGMGLPQAILTGSRTPQLISKIKEFSRKHKGDSTFREVNQPYYPVLPRAAVLHVSDSELLTLAAEFLNIEAQVDFPASSALLAFSKGTEQIYNDLKFEYGDELNWLKRVFSLKTLSFTNTSSDKESISLSEYTNQTTQRKIYMLWKDGKGAVVNRDWGRYIFLWKNKYNALLFFENTFQLAIPVTIPLPAIIARALTLQTGFVPVEKFINQNKYLVFSGISRQLVKSLSAKLGQSIINVVAQN